MTDSQKRGTGHNDHHRRADSDFPFGVDLDSAMTEREKLPFRRRSESATMTRPPKELMPDLSLCRLTDGALMKQETDLWQAVARSCALHLDDQKMYHEPLRDRRITEQKK
jgi:hypothetical protein